MSDRKFVALLTLLAITTLCAGVGLAVMVFKDSSEHFDVTKVGGGVSSGISNLGNHR